MITLARFNSSEILPLIGLGRAPIILDGYTIKVGSTRLECLKRNQKCVSCHRVGTVFLLQSHAGETPHLNLFHVMADKEPEDWGSVAWKSMWKNMMTQDHIIPKCSGGSDSIENLQTMCSSCNHKKGGSTTEQPARNPNLPTRKKKRKRKKNKNK